MEQNPKFRLDIQFFAEDPAETEEEDSDQVDTSEVDEGSQEEPNEQGDGENDESEEGQGEGTPPRNRKRDALMAKKRRQAEAAAREQAEKQKKLQQESYDQGRIAALGGTNPYTKKPIKTAYDLHIYDVMKSLDEKGIEPSVANVVEALSQEENARQTEENERQEKAKKVAEETQKNIAEFVETYPELGKKWLEEQINTNPTMQSLLDHGYTPKQACEILGIKPKKNAPPPPPPSTPSNTRSGSPTPPKKVRDMTDDEFIAYMEEKHGSL